MVGRQEVFNVGGAGPRNPIAPAASSLVRNFRHGMLPTPMNGRFELRVETGQQQHKLFKQLEGNTIGDRLAFTFFEFEDGIPEVAQVNYADIDVIGRAEVFKNFVGNNNREFNLTFKFRAQGISGETLVPTLNQEVKLPALWIDALKFALIDRSGISRPPPTCILQIGQLFIGRVIVTDAQITWMSPFDPDSLLPYGADVNTTLTVVNRRIKNYSFSNPSRRRG